MLQEAAKIVNQYMFRKQRTRLLANVNIDIKNTSFKIFNITGSANGL